MVRGEAKDIRYQSFLCRGGARFMDFIASPGERIERAGRRVIEIQFGPDFGWLVSRVASSFVPKLRFWFDANDEGIEARTMPRVGSSGDRHCKLQSALASHILAARGRPERPKQTISIEAGRRLTFRVRGVQPGVS